MSQAVSVGNEAKVNLNHPSDLEVCDQQNDICREIIDKQVVYFERRLQQKHASPIVCWCYLSGGSTIYKY